MSDFGKFCVAFWIVVGISLVGGFAFKIGRNKGYSEGYSAYHPSDTIVRVDTHYVDNPIEIIKWKDREKPVYIAVHDTTRINDTTFVVLPKEFKVYEDSTYRAQVSGVEPNLDWINVYQKTVTVTSYVPEYKYPTFALSPTIGGFIFPGDYGVGAGLELNYWLNRWEISGGGGYYVSENSKGPYGEIKLKYNLVRK